MNEKAIEAFVKMMERDAENWWKEAIADVPKEDLVKAMETIMKEDMEMMQELNASKNNVSMTDSSDTMDLK